MHVRLRWLQGSSEITQRGNGRAVTLKPRWLQPVLFFPLRGLSLLAVSGVPRNAPAFMLLLVAKLRCCCTVFCKHAVLNLDQHVWLTLLYCAGAKGVAFPFR